MSTPPEPEQGEQGPAGAQGDPGKSAYEVWLEANPGGTLEQFFDHLKGEPGEPGPPGLTGDPGDPGLTGTPGPSVFDLWLEDNPGGTREEFFESLRGPAGPAGPRSLAEIRTVNSDVRRIYLSTTTPVDGVQPGDFQISAASAPVAGRRWSTGSPQSIPSNAHTNMGLGANTDYSGGVATGTNGMSVPVDGFYQVSAGVAFAASGSGYRILTLLQSGTAITRTMMAATAGMVQTPLSLSVLVRCTAGDVFSCQVWQNSGSDLSTSVSFGFPYLAVALVGGA